MAFYCNQGYHLSLNDLLINDFPARTNKFDILIFTILLLLKPTKMLRTCRQKTDSRKISRLNNNNNNNERRRRKKIYIVLENICIHFIYKNKVTRPSCKLIPFIHIFVPKDSLVTKTSLTTALNLCFDYVQCIGLAFKQTLQVKKYLSSRRSPTLTWYCGDELRSRLLPFCHSLPMFYCHVFRFTLSRAVTTRQLHPTNNFFQKRI